MMVSRKLLSELKYSLRNFQVTGIIGPRQCGKTTMSKMVMQICDKPVIYLDMENKADESKIEDAGLFFKDNRNKLIVIEK